MVLESGLLREGSKGYELAGALPSLAIPTTLRESLSARLDRLSGARAVAQQAAVLGREFTFELLRAMTGAEASLLERQLGELTKAEILHRRGLPPDATYSFNHALIWEAAYDTLLRSTRQQLHARVAEIYRRDFPHMLESRPELVAFHSAQAGDTAGAIALWRRAGELASARSAYREAIAHLSAALELIGRLPESAERDASELALRIKLGPALFVTEVRMDRAVVPNYVRAEALGRALGDGPELFMAIWGRWYIAQITRELVNALSRANELVALGRRLGDEDLELEARHARWACTTNIGDVRQALADADAGLAYYRPERHHVHLVSFGGHDTGVCARGHTSINLWLAGRPEQAAAMAELALALGRDLGHSVSLAHACWLCGITRYLLDDVEGCSALASQATQLGEEYGYVAARTLGRLVGGWVATRRGRVAEGIAEIEKVLAAQGASARRIVYKAYLIAILAEAKASIGAFDVALALTDEAIAEGEETGMRLYVPESIACAAAIFWRARARPRPRRKRAS